MSSVQAVRITLGSHVVVREGPITRVILRGELTYENMTRLLAEYESSIDERGFVLILMDVREGGEMAMATRRLATEWGSKRSDCVRTAVFGASFVIRSGIELLNRAASLMGGNAPKITFKAADEEARDWLLAQVPHLPQKSASE